MVWQKIVRPEFLDPEREIDYDLSRRYTSQTEKARTSSIYLTSEAMLFSMEFFVLAKVMQFKPNIIIDLGCGQAMILESVQRHLYLWRAPYYVGVDIRDMRQFVQRKNSLFIQADITKEWPFFPKVCDMIIFSEVLEHMTKKQGIDVLHRMYKTLKVGGRVVLTTPAWGYCPCN